MKKGIVKECPVCGEIFDILDYERYEDHLLSKHEDMMKIVKKLDECEYEEEYELILDLVRLGYGNNDLPDWKNWKGKNRIVDIYYLHGWDALIYVGKALRKQQLEIEYANNKI